MNEAELSYLVHYNQCDYLEIPFFGVFVQEVGAFQRKLHGNASNYGKRNAHGNGACGRAFVQMQRMWSRQTN